MKAIIRKKAGKDFSTMKVENIPAPIVRAGELKVKMVSSRINPVDMDLMKGFPTLKYKNPQIGGVDGAGIVIETATNVANFKPGDIVFFYRKFDDIGTWAEEITVKAADCAKVPDNIKVNEAGAIALPLLTAYDSLKQLNTKRSEKILIHGVGGGVGFQALQVAKQLGLFVVGTASKNDKAVLEKAGLDQFIDYKTQDFAQVLKPGEVKYVFDLLGDDTLKKSIALKPEKIVSVKYVEPANMYKAGVKLPAILKWIMKLMMQKFDMLAKKHHVKIIGQVTGANGPLLQEAVDLIGINFFSRNYPSLKFTDIVSSGLIKSDVGKIIIF